MQRSYYPALVERILSLYRLQCAVTNDHLAGQILTYARCCLGLKIQLENAAELLKVVFTNKFDFENWFDVCFLLLHQSLDLSDGPYNLREAYEDCIERRRLQLAQSNEKEVQLRSSARPKFAVGMVVRWGNYVGVIVSWRVVAKESASEASMNQVQYSLCIDGTTYLVEGNI